MKDKIILAALTLAYTIPASAGPDGGTGGAVPEPSTLALFAATAIAVTVLAKLKK